MAVAIPDEFKTRADGYPYGDLTYPIFDFDWQRFAQKKNHNRVALEERILAKALTPRARSISTQPSGAPAVIG